MLSLEFAAAVSQDQCQDILFLNVQNPVLATMHPTATLPLY